VTDFTPDDVKRAKDLLAKHDMKVLMLAIEARSS
jgi:hypothetical protein